jgi:hypothetical protein
MRLELVFLHPDGQGLRIESQSTAQVKYPGDTPAPGPFVNSLRVEAEHLGGLFAGQRAADGFKRLDQAHEDKYAPDRGKPHYRLCGLTQQGESLPHLVKVVTPNGESAGVKGRGTCWETGVL